jgi:type III secretory pathway component EscS
MKTLQTNAKCVCPRLAVAAYFVVIVGVILFCTVLQHCSRHEETLHLLSELIDVFVIFFLIQGPMSSEIWQAYFTPWVFHLHGTI